MQRTIYTTACFLGALTVIIGAFGAHTLRETLALPADRLETFETGVRYQFYHILALFLAAYFMGVVNNKFPKWGAYCFIAGILLFSGSVYLLAIRDVIGLINYKWLGPITPLGGMCFIAGWVLLGVGVLKTPVK